MFNIKPDEYDKIKKLLGCSQDVEILLSDKAFLKKSNCVIAKTKFSYVTYFTKYENFNGRYQENGSPSGIYFYHDNDNICVLSTKLGAYHHKNLPAIIVYKDGSVINEEYYLNGKRHNKIGPSSRIFNQKFWMNSFYINDKRISLDEFCKQIEVCWG